MYKLCIEDDEGQQTIIPIIRDEITIGRQEGNTIRLTERNVSRQHARLLRQNQQVFIEEIAARYGVRKNGEKIDQREPFAEGDIFLIGDYRLTLQSDAPPTLAKKPESNGAPAPSFGASIPSASPGRAPRPEGTEVLPAKPAKLVVISSNFAGQEFPLSRKEMIIGRGEECDIIIDHRSVSQKHAKIVRESSATYQIVDLNSKNGVCISGEKYTNVHLKRGDVVELGHVKFRFVEPGENYIFTPSNDDFDGGDATALASPGFNEPIKTSSGNGKYIAIIAIAVVAVVVAGLFAGGIIGGDKSKNTNNNPIAKTDQNNTPTNKTDTQDVFKTSKSSNPKVAAGITKAKTYYENGDMTQAIAALETLNDFANPSAEDKVTIGKLLSKARSEKVFEGDYALAKSMIKQEDYRKAAKAIHKIPPHSIYKKLLSDQKATTLTGLVDLSKDAAKDKDYSEAKEIIEEALTLDENHAAALAMKSKLDNQKNKPIAVAKKNTRPKTDKKNNPPDKKVTPKKVAPKKLTKEETQELANNAVKSFIAGNSNEAIKQCKEVLRNGGKKDCYRIIGLSYHKMGNKTKACKNLSRAYKANLMNKVAIKQFMDKLTCDP